MVDIIRKEYQDYYECPNCGGGFITTAFNRCIDCDIKLTWIEEEDMLNKFCKCGEVKTPYYTLGGERHACPVCNPSIDAVQEAVRLRMLDMQDEMEVNDDD